MGTLRNFVTPLHKATARDVLARMIDDKVGCMLKAKEYEYDYWDGSRRFGYGGYNYLPGRWKPVAEALIATYGLQAGSRVLDVGCGKSFLLYEMQLLEPGLDITGFDISQHGLASVRPELKAHLFSHRAQDPYPFADKSFDAELANALAVAVIFPQIHIADVLGAAQIKDAFAGRHLLDGGDGISKAAFDFRAKLLIPLHVVGMDAAIGLRRAIEDEETVSADGFLVAVHESIQALAMLQCPGAHVPVVVMQRRVGFVCRPVIAIGIILIPLASHRR